MSIAISSDLKLTFPIKWNDAGEPTVYAYHTPISRQVFEMNYRLIGGTLAMLQSKSVGTNVVDVATLALKDIGRRDAREWGLPEGLSVEDGGMAVPLLAELKRLTSIIAPTPEGYRSIPVDKAIQGNLISAEDWEEAESALVFFCAGFSTKRRNLATVAADLASPLGGSITSLLPSDWIASLPGLTTIPPASAPVPEPPTTPEIPQ
jgi:hypothetical protein